MKKLTVLLLTLTLLKDIQTINVQNAECNNYKTLPRDNERSVNNTAAPSDQSLIPCDDSLDGWYRFQTGEIATSCVAPNHCGTSSTIWMRDAVPDIGHTDENEFCVNHDTSTNSNPCCLFTMRINVTNCGGFLVYDFRGQDVLCPAGYCSDKLDFCPLGKTSSTGFEPCTGATYPVMTTPPILQPPVISPDGHSFTQTCAVNFDGPLHDVNFRVTWLFDNNVYKVETLTNGTKTASLTSDDWKGNIGKKLSCEAEAYFVSQQSSNVSHILGSNQFYGEIVLTTSASTITEGETATLTLASSLPLVCSDVPLDRCSLALVFDVHHSDIGALAFVEGCSLVIYGDQWDPVSHSIVLSKSITRVVDPMYTARHQSRVVLIPSSQRSMGNSIFPMNQTLEVDVIAYDEKHDHCLAIGLGTIIGLVGTSTYNVGNVTGDLLLYKGSHQLEVHVRTWRPRGGLSSVCGVALRYKHTLLKIDMCTDRPDMVAPVVTQGRADTGDVLTYLCGSTYEVMTSEGVRMSVLMNPLHLDIRLHIAGNFLHHHHGLCTLKHTSDLDKQRLNRSESFFEDAGMKFYKTNVQVNRPVTYCQCEELHTKCGIFQHTHDPGAPLIISKTGEENIKDGCSLVTPHTLNPGTIPIELLPSADTGNKTHHSSLSTHCLVPMRQHVSQYCLSRYRYQQNIYRQHCEEDYRANIEHGHMEDTVGSWAQGFNWYCQEASLNIYYTNIPTATATLMCSSPCTMHGVCKNGLCACDTGYEGPDCSVKKTEPPLVLDIVGGSMCGMSQETCLHPILITRNVAPGANLQVHVRMTDVLSAQPQNISFTLEPVYENKYSISLPMINTVNSFTIEDRSVLQLTLMVTRDGLVYSDPFSYTVYDDKCQMCTSHTVCLHKANSCRINGRCYIDKEVNPNNSSQICEPSKAKLNWAHL